MEKLNGGGGGALLAWPTTAASPQITMEIHISEWTHRFQNKTGLNAKANSGNYINPIRLTVCCPSDSTVSEEAGIEPRTVATLALTDLIKLELHSLSFRFPTISLLLPVTRCQTLRLCSSCGQINSEVDIESPEKIENQFLIG